MGPRRLVYISVTDWNVVLEGETMRAIVLESIHGLSSHRAYLAFAPMTLVGEYQVRTAPCGCQNRTRIYPGIGPTADGVTSLCEQHGPPDDE